MIGAIAKAVATVLTYPLQIAQCKQRVMIVTLEKIGIKEQGEGNEEISERERMRKIK